MMCFSSPSNTCITLCSAVSARRKTYLPAGSVTPGICTGPLKVRYVRWLTFESCAEAVLAPVRNAAVKTAAAIEVNRFILSSCFASIPDALNCILYAPSTPSVSRVPLLNVCRERNRAAAARYCRRGHRRRWGGGSGRRHLLRARGAGGPNRLCRRRKIDRREDPRERWRPLQCHEPRRY